MSVPEIAGYGELREIGRGGYSRVYEAREFEFDRLVAVKVLNDPLKDSATAAAFERECRTMGRLLHHPNIVTVIKSAFTAEDQPCIVMELFHQGSYFAVLRNSGPVPHGEVLRVGVKMAGALATAHLAGVLHGDVKPHNIFRSLFGEPALGDFGISTFVSRRDGKLPRGFSVHYAAPELIDGAPDAAADQYSLAATLYTLALGRRPFEAPDASTGSTNEQVLLRVLKEPVPRLPGRFPAPLAEALWRAMAKDPDYRFEDLTEFAAALNAAEEEAGLQPTVMPLDTNVAAVGPAGASQVSGTMPRGGSNEDPGTGAVAEDDVGTAADGPADAVDVAAGAKGRVVFADGQVELLDADLIVGRNPSRSPTAPHQRAVEQGEGDRTVSRRHIELQRADDQVVVVCLGQHAAVVDAAGAAVELYAGDTRPLALGDTVYFGTEAWLRYEPSPVGDDAEAAPAPPLVAAPSGPVAGDEPAVQMRDSTTRNLPVVEPERDLDSGSEADVQGSVVLSDGRVELLDADLIIGRSPGREPLEPNQRAIVHGTDDRTVSRRHVEVRSLDGEVQAVNLGRYTTLTTAAGEARDLETGEIVDLAPGDELRFGTESWLRYNAPEGAADHQAAMAPRTDAET